MWGKNARNNFSRKRIVRAKNFGEKIVGKKWENVFLYSHKYRYQKIVGKKRAEQLFQKHTNSASKKCWGKNRRKKVGKAFFYIHTNIVTKKWGEKRAKQFFQKHKISAIKKCWEKNRRKKVRKTFFYIHTNIVTKKWEGKTARNNYSRNTRIVRAKNVGEKIVG